MCMYIGIEDLAANALIEMLDRPLADGAERREVSFEDLHRYGECVAKVYQQTSGEEAILICSRDSTEHFFSDYSRFFEPMRAEDDAIVGVRLRKGVAKVDLLRTFRYNLELKLLKAFLSDQAKDGLFRRAA